MITINDIELNYLIGKLPLHTLRGRIYDLLGIDRGDCKKNINRKLKVLASVLEINNNARSRQFWEVLYKYFSKKAMENNNYEFFNPCRDEPPEIKDRLSKSLLYQHRKYYQTRKGRKNLLKSVKAYKQRNKKSV